MAIISQKKAYSRKNPTDKQKASHKKDLQSTLASNKKSLASAKKSGNKAAEKIYSRSITKLESRLAPKKTAPKSKTSSKSKK